MPITWRAPATGREYTLPEPDDEPVRRPQARAKAIARMDASSDWQRVETPDADAGDDGTAPDAGNPAPAPRPKSADVRAWAREQGIEVAERGRLDPELVERYKAAHA